MRSTIMDPTVDTFAGFIVEPIDVLTMDMEDILRTPMEDIIRTPMEDITVRPISGDGVFRRRLEPVGTLSDVEVGEVV